MHHTVDIDGVPYLIHEAGDDPASGQNRHKANVDRVPCLVMTPEMITYVLVRRGVLQAIANIATYSVDQCLWVWRLIADDT